MVESISNIYRKMIPWLEVQLPQVSTKHHSTGGHPVMDHLCLGLHPHMTFATNLAVIAISSNIARAGAGSQVCLGQLFAGKLGLEANCAFVPN